MTQFRTQHHVFRVSGSPELNLRFMMEVHSPPWHAPVDLRTEKTATGEGRGLENAHRHAGSLLLPLQHLVPLD